MNKIVFKNILLILIVFGSFTALAGKKKKDPSILTINKQNIPLSEFEYIYNKNNQRDTNAYSKQSLEEYLELYINFKLKVLEAENQKLDTIQEFVNELNGYKKQLARPYLSEKGFKEKLAKEAYERKKHEVRAAHILIRVEAEADPLDTLEAYNKLLDIKKKIDAGMDFGTAAFKFSEDPSAKSPEGKLGHNGDLDYFTVFMMDYDFESGAYNTPVGQISKPIRSAFGYHLIHVLDKREWSGEVEVAHIMIAAAEGVEAAEAENAKRKVDEIYSKLNAGESWDELCAKYSDHAPSKNKGGAIQPFSKNGWTGQKEFENVAFELTNIGDISNPVKSAFGWHIIKLIKKTPLGTYESLEKELLSKVGRGRRSQLNQDALYSRLKKEDSYTEETANLKKVFAIADSTLIAGKWTPNTKEEINKLKLFTIKNENYFAKDYIDYILQKQKPRKNTSVSYLMELYFKSYVNDVLYAYEETHLEEKYYDYKMLVKEYRDGILLFRLMDDMVWKKAMKDTLGLQEFYNQHKGDFMWKERVEASIYTLENETIIPSLQKDIESGLSSLELKTKYNKSSSLNLDIKTSTFEKGNNNIIDQASWKKGFHQVKVNGKTYLVEIKEVKPMEQRTLEDSKGLIISKYQDFLEKEWIKELRSKNEVVVNQKVIKKLIKN